MLWDSDKKQFVVDERSYSWSGRAEYQKKWEAKNRKKRLVYKKLGQNFREMLEKIKNIFFVNKKRRTCDLI